MLGRFFSLRTPRLSPVGTGTHFCQNWHALEGHTNVVKAAMGCLIELTVRRMEGGKMAISRAEWAFGGMCLCVERNSFVFAVGMRREMCSKVMGQRGGFVPVFAVRKIARMPKTISGGKRGFTPNWPAPNLEAKD